MIRDLVRYRALIRNLVLKELTLKYRGSILGVAWSLAHPALLLAVYTLAFRHVLRVPVPHYPFFLLVALLPWNFFAAAATAATGPSCSTGRFSGRRPSRAKRCPSRACSSSSPSSCSPWPSSCPPWPSRAGPASAGRRCCWLPLLHPPRPLHRRRRAPPGRGHHRLARRRALHRGRARPRLLAHADRVSRRRWCRDCGAARSR